MRIGVQRSVRVKADKLHLFEFLMSSFLDDVAVLEDGCIDYTIMQSPTNKLTFTFHETYANDAVWQAHQTTNHWQRWWPYILPLVESMTCSEFKLGEDGD